MDHQQHARPTPSRWCLGYAFPKVLLLSVIVSAVIYVVTNNDSKAQ
jgi:hypothetical protein